MRTAPETAAPAVDTETITPDEQAQLDEMRDAPNEAVDEAPAEPSGGREAATPDDGDGAADGGVEPDKPRQQMVPHAALHEERERRKDAENRARILEERTNLILQRFAQPPQQAQPDPANAIPEVPDLDKDPVGHIVGKQQLQGRALEQVVQLLQGERQRQEQSAQITQIQQRAIALENEYKATVPDYDAAVAHLANMRNEELKLAGFVDPAERQRIVGQEALGVAARAIQQGRNPAELIYELAKLRGHIVAPPAAQNGDAGEKIGNIAAGQQQRRSLGATRGSGPAPLTAQRLLELSDAEFLKMLDKPEGKELMG